MWGIKTKPTPCRMAAWVESTKEALEPLLYFLELPMQHRLLAQQAQQQNRGMEFVIICLNNNNVEA
jgi:hypothetical protein